MNRRRPAESGSQMIAYSLEASYSNHESSPSPVMQLIRYGITCVLHVTIILEQQLGHQLAVIRNKLSVLMASQKCVGQSTENTIT